MNLNNCGLFVVEVFLPMPLTREPMVGCIHCSIWYRTRRLLNLYAKHMERAKQVPKMRQLVRGWSRLYRCMYVSIRSVYLISNPPPSPPPSDYSLPSTQTTCINNITLTAQRISRCRPSQRHARDTRACHRDEDLLNLHRMARRRQCVIWFGNVHVLRRSIPWSSSPRSTDFLIAYMLFLALFECDQS